MRPQQKLGKVKIKKTVKKDRLSHLLELQACFASKFCEFEKLTLTERERWTKEYIICIIDECSEVLNWTNWKHWKSEKKHVDIDELKTELVDILHFLLDLFLVWGMTADEVYQIYQAKNNENHKRQKRGY